LHRHCRTVTFDDDYAGDKVASITITATDNHDQKQTKTFTLILNTWAGFWTNLNNNLDNVKAADCKDCQNRDTGGMIRMNKANGAFWQIDQNANKDSHLSEGAVLFFELWFAHEECCVVRIHDVSEVEASRRVILYHASRVSASLPVSPCILSLH
jgi:hypothetical protein